jgi:hypothetical protein
VSSSPLRNTTPARDGDDSATVDAMDVLAAAAAMIAEQETTTAPPATSRSVVDDGASGGPHVHPCAALAGSPAEGGGDRIAPSTPSRWGGPTVVPRPHPPHLGAVGGMIDASSFESDDDCDDSTMDVAASAAINVRVLKHCNNGCEKEETGSLGRSTQSTWCARPDVEKLNKPTNINAPTTNVTERHQMQGAMVGTSSLSMQSTVLSDSDPENIVVTSFGEMINKPNSPKETDRGVLMPSQTSSMTCGNRTNLETSKVVDFVDEPAANIMSVIHSLERNDGQCQVGRNNGTATRNLLNKDGGERKLLSDPGEAAAIDVLSLECHSVCNSDVPLASRKTAPLDASPMVGVTIGSSRLDETSTEREPSPSSPEAIDEPKSPEEKDGLDVSTPDAFAFDYADSRPRSDDSSWVQSDPPSPRDASDFPRGRKIGRIRRYRERDMAYGDWLDIYDDCDGPSRRIGTRVGRT